MERLSVFTPPRLEGDQATRRLIRAVATQCVAYERSFHNASRTRSAPSIAHANSARTALENDLTLLQSVTGISNALFTKWHDTCATGRNLLVATHLLDPAEAVPMEEGDSDDDSNTLADSINLRNDSQNDDSSDDEDLVVGTVADTPTGLAGASVSTIGNLHLPGPALSGFGPTNVTCSPNAALPGPVLTNTMPRPSSTSLGSVSIHTLRTTLGGSEPIASSAGGCRVTFCEASAPPYTTPPQTSAATSVAVPWPGNVSAASPGGEYVRACNVVCNAGNTVQGPSYGAGPSRSFYEPLPNLTPAGGAVISSPHMQMPNTLGTWSGAASVSSMVSLPSGGASLGESRGPLVHPMEVNELVLTHRMMELARQLHGCERQMAEARVLGVQRAAGEGQYASCVQPGMPIVSGMRDCGVPVSGARSVAPVSSVFGSTSSCVDGSSNHGFSVPPVGSAGVNGVPSCSGGSSAQGVPVPTVYGDGSAFSRVDGSLIQGMSMPPVNVGGNPGSSCSDGSSFQAGSMPAVDQLQSVGVRSDGPQVPPVSNMFGNYVSGALGGAAVQCVSAPENVAARMSTTVNPISSRLMELSNTSAADSYITFPPSQSPSGFSFQPPPSYQSVLPYVPPNSLPGSTPSLTPTSPLLPQVNVPSMQPQPQPQPSGLDLLFGVNAKTNARQLLVARRPQADKRFSGDTDNADYEAFIRRFDRNMKVEGADDEMILLEVTHYVKGTAEVIAASYEDIPDAKEALRLIKAHWRKEFGKRVHSARQLLETYLKGGPLKQENASAIRTFICSLEAVYRQSKGTARAKLFDNNDLINEVIRRRVPTFARKWAQKLQINLDKQAEDGGEDVPDLTFQDFLNYLSQANGAQLHELAIQKRSTNTNFSSTSDGTSGAPNPRWRWAKVAVLDPEVEGEVVEEVDEIEEVDEEMDVSVAAAMTSRPRSKVKSTNPSATRMLQPNYLATAAADPAGGHACLGCKAFGPLYHDLKNCRAFLKLSVEERNRFVRLHSICRNCFQPGHWSSRCPSQDFCKIVVRGQACGKDHNSLLHRDPTPVGPPGPMVSK